MCYNWLHESIYFRSLSCAESHMLCFSTSALLSPFFFVVKADVVYYHCPQKFLLIQKPIYMSHIRRHLHSLEPVLAGHCFHYGQWNCQEEGHRRKILDPFLFSDLSRVLVLFSHHGVWCRWRHGICQFSLCFGHYADPEPTNF